MVKYLGSFSLRAATDSLDRRLTDPDAIRPVPARPGSDTEEGLLLSAAIATPGDCRPFDYRGPLFDRYLTTVRPGPAATQSISSSPSPPPPPETAGLYLTTV